VAAVALLASVTAAMAAAAGAAVRWDVVQSHLPDAVRSVIDWARSPWKVPLPRPAGPSLPTPVATNQSPRAPEIQVVVAIPAVARGVSSAVPSATADKPMTAPPPTHPTVVAGATNARGVVPWVTSRLPSLTSSPRTPEPIARSDTPRRMANAPLFSGERGMASAAGASPPVAGAVPRLHVGPEFGTAVQRVPQGVLVVASPPGSAPPVDIGNGGALHLGGDDGGGTIVQPFDGPPPSWHPRSTDDLPPTSLRVRGDSAAGGTISGWGGAVGNGGILVNNGRIVADGGGQDRALIFSGYAAVQNTVDNPANGRNGWFAKDGGRLILPKLTVLPGTHTYTWGENEDDPTIDLVNSVRVTLEGAKAPGKLDISLLDKSRADVPALPTGHTFIGVWSFDAGATRATGVDLTVRYDDGLAKSLGLNESVLKLWRYDGTQWVRINDSSFARDLGNHLLSGHAEELTFFAVSAPEPSALACLAGIAGMALLRRRR